MVFQGEMGARIAGLMLSERPLSRIIPNVPGAPRRILFETPASVDDLLVETDTGEVYIQAKRTLSLSAEEVSELASVAEQFVGQFRAGIREAGFRRDLDPARDRLVLAVSEDAPATIRRDLMEVLDRGRTGAATGLPAKLADAQKTFSDHVDREWRSATGADITDAERAAVLRVCSVAVIGDAQRQIVDDACRDVVATASDERTLGELLDRWGADASARGTGGDAAAIRLAVSGGVRLREPPSYARDVARLAEHSASVVRRLERFTSLATPEGRLHIARPVATTVAAAAREASLVVTGDPGAGKSAVLHDVAGELGGSGPVVVLTVEATAVSLEALRLDLGLEHGLIDVLRNVPGERPAYLVLDALDAVRGGPAEATYKRLVEEVLELPGWRVVASVRTFDLKLGRHWKSLFAGRPVDASRADPSFPNVRHVHVALLDEFESADIAARSASLAPAIRAGGEKMAALARNPFNLALVGDLLTDGIDASALAAVSTRGELLERYWDVRISDLGLPATVALAGVVRRMVDDRTVEVPETRIDMAAAPTVQELERVGVLVTEATRRIGFRHHILFDYAVARLLLLPDDDQALPRLSKALGAGLLIAPSLGYWLEVVKRTRPAGAFWALVARLTGAPDIDPIVRVEIARLAVESVGPTEHLGALIPYLGGSS